MSRFHRRFSPISSKLRSPTNQREADSVSKIVGVLVFGGWADRRDDVLRRWVKQIQARRGHNKAVVALANKLARIAWVVIAKGERFDMNKAFSG